MRTEKQNSFLTEGQKQPHTYQRPCSPKDGKTSVRCWGEQQSRNLCAVRTSLKTKVKDKSWEHSNGNTDLHKEVNRARNSNYLGKYKRFFPHLNILLTEPKEK